MANETVLAIIVAVVVLEFFRRGQERRLMARIEPMCEAMVMHLRYSLILRTGNEEAISLLEDLLRFSPAPEAREVAVRRALDAWPKQMASIDVAKQDLSEAETNATPDARETTLRAYWTKPFWEGVFEDWAKLERGDAATRLNAIIGFLHKEAAREARVKRRSEEVGAQSSQGESP